VQSKKNIQKDTMQKTLHQSRLWSKRIQSITEKNGKNLKKANLAAIAVLAIQRSLTFTTQTPKPNLDQ